VAVSKDELLTRCSCRPFETRPDGTLLSMRLVVVILSDLEWL